MKYTYSDIIESLPIKKNSNSSWWVKLWVRKTSFLFTYIFINLGFTSNMVSLLSIIITLLACISFGISSKLGIYIGVFFINFWLILDCVDGNIARCKKNKTVYGEFIDDMSGYFTTAFIYFSISIVSYYNGGLVVEKNCIAILILGAISSISDILARLIHKDYVCFGYEGNVLKKEKVGTNLEQNKKSLNYIRSRIGKEIGISGLFMPLVIFSVFYNFYDIITIFYFCFNIFALISTVILLYYKANKYDNEEKNEK